MQPAAQGVAGADRPRLPRQQQEGGLERVLDVLLVIEHGTAGGDDHRTVPRHQGRERRLVARGGIPGQELAVAEPDGRAVLEQVAQMPQASPHHAACHGCHPQANPRP